MYGAGEMPQAFCRLCAVFGGTYFLGRKIDGIVVSGDGDVKVCKAIIAQGRRQQSQKAMVVSVTRITFNDISNALHV